MSGDPMQHTCVSPWMGIYPPPRCLACHPMPQYGWTHAFGEPAQLSDGDVDRIAKRVAEIIASKMENPAQGRALLPPTGRPAGNKPDIAARDRSRKPRPRG